MLDFLELISGGPSSADPTMFETAVLEDSRWPKRLPQNGKGVRAPPACGLVAYLSNLPILTTIRVRPA